MPPNPERDAELAEIVREFLGTADVSDLSTRQATARESEWLKIQYESKLRQHLEDQGRIWITAATFVPLALAPFALVLLRADPLRVGHVGIAAVPSMLLLVVWVLLSERMQFHADRNLDWVRAIRREVGIDASDRSKNTPVRQRTMRRILVALVAVAWAAAALAVGGGYL